MNITDIINKDDLTSLDGSYFPLMWGYQCHANGCEETFLEIEDWTEHMLNTLNDTHTAFAASYKELRSSQPCYLKTIAESSKVPVVMWQGHCIKAVNWQMVSKKIISSNFSNEWPGPVSSVPPTNIPSTLGQARKQIDEVGPDLTKEQTVFAKPSHSESLGQQQQSEAKKKTIRVFKKLTDKGIFFDEESGYFKCLAPDCGFQTLHRPNSVRHSVLHTDKPVNGYGCLAKNCTYTTPDSGHILVHIKVRGDERKSDRPHKEFYLNNKFAIENSKTNERRQFLRTLVCLVVRSVDGFERYTNNQEQEREASNSKRSEISFEQTIIAQNRVSLMQEAAAMRASLNERSFALGAPQADISFSTPSTPVEPSPIEEQQELRLSQPSQELVSIAVDQAVDLDSGFPSYINEDFSLYPEEYAQDHLANTDSSTSVQDLIEIASWLNVDSFLSEKPEFKSADERFISSLGDTPNILIPSDSDIPSQNEYLVDVGFVGAGVKTSQYPNMAVQASSFKRAESKERLDGAKRRRITE